MLHPVLKSAPPDVVVVEIQTKEKTKKAEALAQHGVFFHEKISPHRYEEFHQGLMQTMLEEAR